MLNKKHFYILILGCLTGFGTSLIGMEEFLGEEEALPAPSPRHSPEPSAQQLKRIVEISEREAEIKEIDREIAFMDQILKEAKEALANPEKAKKESPLHIKYKKQINALNQLGAIIENSTNDANDYKQYLLTYLENFDTTIREKSAEKGLKPGTPEYALARLESYINGTRDPKSGKTFGFGYLKEFYTTRKALLTKKLQRLEAEEAGEVKKSSEVAKTETAKEEAESEGEEAESEGEEEGEESEEEVSEEEQMNKAMAESIIAQIKSVIENELLKPQPDLNIINAGLADLRSQAKQAEAGIRKFINNALNQLTRMIKAKEEELAENNVAHLVNQIEMALKNPHLDLKAINEILDAIKTQEGRVSGAVRMRISATLMQLTTQIQRKIEQQSEETVAALAHEIEQELQSSTPNVRKIQANLKAIEDERNGISESAARTKIEHMFEQLQGKTNALIEKPVESIATELELQIKKELKNPKPNFDKIKHDLRVIEEQNNKLSKESLLRSKIAHILDQLKKEVRAKEPKKEQEKKLAKILIPEIRVQLYHADQFSNRLNANTIETGQQRKDWSSLIAAMHMIVQFASSLEESEYIQFKEPVQQIHKRILSLFEAIAKRVIEQQNADLFIILKSISDDDQWGSIVKQLEHIGLLSFDDAQGYALFRDTLNTNIALALLPPQAESKARLEMPKENAQLLAKLSKEMHEKLLNKDFQQKIEQKSTSQEIAQAIQANVALVEQVWNILKPMESFLNPHERVFMQQLVELGAIIKDKLEETQYPISFTPGRELALSAYQKSLEMMQKTNELIKSIISRIIKPEA
jgi:hypothetical protein